MGAFGIFSALFLAGAALAAEPTPEYADQAACMEGPMAQFGRYIGDWDIDDERLAADGSIVMNVLNPESKPRRITFYPPTGEGWHWKMEWSFDDGMTWTEVYRIKATRRRPETT